MKHTRRPLLLGTSVAAVLVLLATGCAPEAATEQAGDPLWESGPQRDKTVIISDLHLGIDDEFTETLENRPLLVEFLQRLRQTDDVRELVIAGDFLDEWYLPVSYPGYTDQDAFYREVIANNQTVIDELNSVADSGISLVYLPGNHDMTLSAEVLQEALPSLTQERDVEGLGAYRLGERDEIVIEHGHRYDMFSAPDTLTNAALCNSDDTMLPAGYIYARYGATWVLENRPSVEKDLPQVTTPPSPDDVDQYSAYVYHQIITAISEDITPTAPIDAPIFDLRMSGFCGTYSYLDFFPAQQADGTITAPVLYPDVQRTWEERQRLNNVAVPNSFIESATGALNWRYFTEQARVQYFDNPAETAEIVVFGHSHVPTVQSFGDNAQYLNSGTWVDDSSKYPQGPRSFVVITTGDTSSAALYSYGEDGAVVDLGAGADPAAE